MVGRRRPRLARNILVIDRSIPILHDGISNSGIYSQCAGEMEMSCPNWADFVDTFRQSHEFWVVGGRACRSRSPSDPVINDVREAHSLA